jgi:serine/threonine-protein kinase HipA
MRELLVLLDGELAGTVVQKASGTFTFTYDRAWRNRNDAYPLSLSMPITQAEHPDRVVRPFMENLLPDNADVLKQWSQRFQVSARNPFSLLTHMGEDCAGAVQFVRPARLEELTTGGHGDVEWLTEEAIGERLRDLVERHGTGRTAGDAGYFSLAGAQPKVALLHDGERWGVPSGRVPTTHILKPPAKDLDGFDINEHLSLRLVAELGLASAESRLRSFAGREALVVSRYDRLRDEDGRIVRLHQEDMCQSLGVSPLVKYQNEGGPGPESIVELLFRESSDMETDVAVFIDALALNWAIGGTDAHAKNYSLLLSAGSVRLAPLYDLATVLPYPGLVPYRKSKLAMKIGREDQLWKIRKRHWEELASRCDLDPDPVVDRVGELLAAIPAAMERAVEGVRAEGLDHDIIGRMEVEVREHSEKCLRLLATGKVDEGESRG